MSSPALKAMSSVKASATAAQSLGSHDSLNTSSTAAFTRCASTSSSRPSSKVSVSTLPAVDGVSCAKSHMRGTAVLSPRRSERRTALAIRVS